MNKMFRILPIVVIVAIVLSSCAQATATQIPATEAPTAQPPTAAEPTEAAPAAKITLTYWENFIGTSQAQSYAIAQMEAKYPNLTIEFANYQIDDMAIKLPTALASGSGPDIVYADMNPKWLGRFVNEDLAIPLTEGVQKYGWDQKIFGWAQAFGTYNGELYGIGHEFEVLGLVYNKKIFNELGLQVPQTREDLEAAMAKIKDNSKYVPMFYGCGTGCPNGIHMFNAIAYSMIPIPEVLATTPMGTGSYLDPGWLDALNVLQKWEQAGYFNDDALNYPWEAHWGRFCNGEVAMMAQGSWLFKALSDCAAANPDKVDFGWAPFPVAQGKPYQAYVGVGSGWWLTSQLKDDPEKRLLAMEFLNMLISDEAINKWITEDQIFPAVNFDTTKIPLTEQQKTALEVAKMAGSTGGGPIPICWNNSQEETDVWVKDFQALFLGEITPEQILKDADAVLKTYQAEWKAQNP